MITSADFEKFRHYWRHFKDLMYLFGASGQGSIEYGIMGTSSSKFLLFSRNFSIENLKWRWIRHFKVMWLKNFGWNSKFSPLQRYFQKKWRRQNMSENICCFQCHSRLELNVKHRLSIEKNFCFQFYFWLITSADFEKFRHYWRHFKHLMYFSRNFFD